MNDVTRRGLVLVAWATLLTGTAGGCAAGSGDSAAEAPGATGATDPAGGQVEPGADAGASASGAASGAAAQPGSPAPPEGQSLPAGTAPAAGESQGATAMPAGDAADLAAALGRFADTDRITAAQIVPLCGKSHTCLAELDALERYVRDDCPRDSTCPPAAAAFLQAPDAATGATAGPSATAPTVAEVRDILWKAMYDEAREEGSGAGAATRTDQSEPPESGATPEGAPATVPPTETGTPEGAASPQG